MNDDDGLRERFAAMRRDDATRTPSFARTLRGTRPATSRRVLLRRAGALAAGIALLAAIAAVPLLQHSRRDSPSSATDAPQLADWRSPTGFLLASPGRELLRTIPRFGQPTYRELNSFPPIDDTRPDHRVEQEPPT